MKNSAGLAEIASWISEAKRVVALTGAGMSTESGIPDFRGPEGVWTKNPEAEKLAHIHHYMSDKQVRINSWKARLASPLWEARPNAAHVALAELEKKGRLHTLVTQNIDGLHQMAGSSREVVIEVHGTAHTVMCMKCGERAPMQRALERVRKGEEDPPCRTCAGILKSATVSFGQQLVPEDIERAELAAATCDVFLAVGTSLTVFPVAYLPEIALRAGARLAIFNQEPTPFDSAADAVVEGLLSVIVPDLVSRI